MGHIVTKSRQSRQTSGLVSEAPCDDGGPSDFKPPELPGAVTALTWNVAAINNNPFEYWITYKDPSYLDLMQGVEEFLDDPGEEDVEISQVFTQAMFEELRGLCVSEGMSGVEELEGNFWCGGELHLASRRIITEFIKDATFGEKRLISMPDRITNTINVVTRQASEYRPPPACRPSVINNYVGDLSTQEVWWERWKAFIFQEPLTVVTKKGVDVQKPVQMLQALKREKYPAVTEEEERVSIPLQLLCLAIFDAVIVHFMNKLSPNCSWLVVKRNICDRLYSRKQELTVEILAKRYSAVQIMCLQEVAAVFKDAFQSSELSVTHVLATPTKLDGARDQNSMIALRRDSFRLETIQEVTSQLMDDMPNGISLADGDLFALDVQSAAGEPYIIVSFHGDTNGLLTMPVVTACDLAKKRLWPNHAVILCLDANVYDGTPKGKKPFVEFLAEVQALGFTTCWGDSPDVSKIRTTCSARTSLQPQLNKAVRMDDRKSKSDMNPKDIILFYRHQFGVVSERDMGYGRQPNPVKDNTGSLLYKEETVFPMLEFPSDHGILAAALQRVS